MRAMRFSPICLLVLGTCLAAATLRWAVVPAGPQAAWGFEAPSSRRTPQRPKVDKEVLREQLTKGLKVTRPDEEAFVDVVVTMVDQDELPVKLVYAIFRWSRDRKPDWPYPYFKVGLVTLAKREGIEIVVPDVQPSGDR